MTVEHVTLTGSQLHEPKGVSAATIKELGVADTNAISWEPWVERQTSTASTSASLNFTNLSQYLMLRLTFVNLLRATSGTTLRFRFSTDNGSTFLDGLDTYRNRWADDAADDGEKNISGNITGDEDDTYLYYNGVLHFYNFNSTEFTTWDGFGIKSSGAGGTTASSGVVSTGFTTYGNAMNALTIFASSGNLTSGSVYLEGFRGT